MNEVQVFNSPMFGQIRTAGSADKPLFCLSDVCKALGLKAKNVRERLEDDVVSNGLISDSLGRKQSALFVNEDGLYDVILDSRKPEAKVFRKWITSEVLPSIRKTGSYSTKQLSASEIMLMQAQMLVESEKRINELERSHRLIQSRQNGVDRRISRMEEQVRMVAYWSTVSGYAIRHKVDMSLSRAMIIGRKATKLAEENRYTVEKVRDIRFGTVNAYPDWILAKVFTEYYPKVKFSY